MSENLYDAFAQWANRPDDERYETIDAMIAATEYYRANARTAKTALGALRVEAQDSQVVLIGKTERPALMTHHSFGQISAMVSAPPGFLRTLPPTLAAQVLNNRLKARADADETQVNLLFHSNGQTINRAIGTDSYDRVWNCDIARRLKSAIEIEGWRVPPARPARPGQKGTRAATAADVLVANRGVASGLEIKVGDQIAPAGLYASDHDMFAFLVKEGVEIEGSQGPLNVGAFIWNSEIGASALAGKIFMYDGVCGNHIVWGVAAMTEFSVRHVKGKEVQTGNTLKNGLKQWRTLTTTTVDMGGIEGGIKAAKSKEIAATKDDVLDAVFSFAKVKKLDRLTKGVIEAAYKVAEQTPRYGSPRSVWGMVNGLTEVSQDGSVHTDARSALDVQAGKVMEMAF